MAYKKYRKGYSTFIQYYPHRKKGDRLKLRKTMKTNEAKYYTKKYNSINKNTKSFYTNRPQRNYYNYTKDNNPYGIRFYAKDYNHWRSDGPQELYRRKGYN